MHKQDPMSHRIIEKRRRDRMNNCLADLSRLIPSTYLKKFQGRGRVEKTEIIEMAIKHLKYLQAHSCNHPPNCEIAKSTEQEKLRHFRLGFHESMSESVRFLVEIEGFYAGNGACIRLVNHLQKHFDKLISGSTVTQKYSDLDTREETMAETMDAESVWNVVVPPESMINFGPQQNEMTECHEWIDDKKTEDREKTLVSKSSNNSDPSTQITTGSSQLRQMLQSPEVTQTVRNRRNSTGENNPNRYSSVSRPSSASSCISQCQFSATHKVEEVYKFKNNIKERFKADSSYVSDPSILSDESKNNRALEAKRVLSTDTLMPVVKKLKANSNLQPSMCTYRYEISGKPCENLILTDSGVALNNWDIVETSSPFFTNRGSSEFSDSSSGYSTGTETSAYRKCQGEQSLIYYSKSPENFSSSSSISPISQPCSGGIPIFALHPKGTFYIPLTMDATLVAPYVDTFDENQHNLHPISISVNFCNPGRTIEKIPRDTWEKSDFFGCER